MTGQREHFDFCSSCGEPEIRRGAELESEIVDSAGQGVAALDDEVDVDELLDELEAATVSDRRSS